MFGTFGPVDGCRGVRRQRHFIGICRTGVDIFPAKQDVERDADEQVEHATHREAVAGEGSVNYEWKCLQSPVCVSSPPRRRYPRGFSRQREPTGQWR